MLKLNLNFCSLSFLCIIVSLWANTAHADPFSDALQLTPDLALGKTEYQQRCAQCHGINGWGSYDGEFPQLAGQHKTVIIKQLADIHNGTRSNPLMTLIVNQLANKPSQLIADIAGYLQTLLMNPEPDTGFGDNLEQAESVYKQHCAECHGNQGEGNADKFYPLLQGQHFEYMLSELQSLRDGKRKNANMEMLELIKAMDDNQLSSLADYLSRLMPPKERLGEPQ